MPGTATTSWGAAFAVALAVLGEVSLARAQASAPAPPSMLGHIHITLEYHSAPKCSEGEVFQQALRFHLYRWDVWAPPAPWRLVLTITPKDKGFAGAAVLWDPAKAIRWGHPVEGPASCTDVLEEIAGALSAALDPDALVPARGPASPPAPLHAAVSTPAPPTPQERPPPTPQELPPPPPVPPPPAPKTPIVWRFGAAVSLDYATAPGLVPGLTVTASGRHGQFSAALQVAWDPRATVSQANGDKDRIARLSGGLLVCRHFFEWFVPCALGEGGEIQVSGTATSAATRALARGAFGGRLGAEVRLGRSPLFLAPGVNILGAFGYPIYGLSPVIKLPALNVGFGVGLLFELDSR